MLKVFLVPYDLDRASTGTGRGPQALIGAGVLDDLSDIDISLIRSEGGPSQAEASVAIDAALAVEAQERAEHQDSIIVFSGNCHACLGTLAAIGSDVSMVWFDAHGDFNTPDTSPSGFLDGMALAMATGAAHRRLTGQLPGFAAVDERHVLLVGGRDLDPQEAARLKMSPVVHYRPPVCSSGPDASEFDEVLATFSGPSRCYVHIDLDVLDPSHLKANRLAVNGGVSPTWLEQALLAVRRRKQIVAVGIASYDPAYDPDDVAPAIVKRVLTAAIGSSVVPE